MANKVITDDILNSYGQEIKDYIDRKDPLISKSWSSNDYYDKTGGSADGAAFYMMYVKPDSWYKSCKVIFRIRTTIPSRGANYDSTSWCELYFRANSVIYSIFNDRYDHAHYYVAANLLTNTGFNQGYGHAVGTSILYSTGYTNKDYPRKFELDYYGCENCTVTILDNPVLVTSLIGYNTDATYRSKTVSSHLNAIDRGLQETGDADSFAYNISDYYNRVNVGTGGVKQYGICTYDKDGYLQSFTTTHGAGTDKTKNTTEFRIGAPFFYSNTGTNYSSGSTVGDSVLRSSFSLIDFRYSSNSGTTLKYKDPVYIVGIPTGNGTYTLDTIWWTQTLPTTENGKIYIFMGTPYPDNSSTASTNYRISWHLYHEILWYKDGKIRPYIDPSTHIHSQYLTEHQDISGKLDKSGGIITGDLTLKSESGDSPALRFQRGTFNTSSDSLNDWQVVVKGGLLYFQNGENNGTLNDQLILGTSTTGAVFKNTPLVGTTKVSLEGHGHTAITNDEIDTLF